LTESIHINRDIDSGEVLRDEEGIIEIQMNMFLSCLQEEKLARKVPTVKRRREGRVKELTCTENGEMHLSRRDLTSTTL
jgi:hypothetical protein